MIIATPCEPNLKSMNQTSGENQMDLNVIRLMLNICFYLLNTSWNSSRDAILCTRIVAIVDA